MNVAPRSITLSASSYAPPSAAANVPVGTLNAIDANAADTHTFALIGGANRALFNIFNNVLRISNAGVVGRTLAIIVRATDPIGAYVDVPFSIQDSCAQSLLCFFA